MLPGTLDGFALAMRDVTDQQLEHGVMLAIQAATEHPPSAGVLRKLCLGNDAASIEAKAAAAWKLVDKAARDNGVAYNPRRLGDPLVVHALGAVGGWTLLCTSPESEWQERNFLKAYINAAGNPQVEEVARLSYEGKPLGALPQVREQLAKQLSRTP